MSKLPPPFNEPRYIVIHCALRGVSDVPWAQEDLHTFEQVVTWVQEMQIDPEHLYMVLEVDLENGTAKDASKRVARAVAAHYRNRGEDPHPSLETWLDDHGSWF